MRSDDPRHGTENGYSNLHCRCEDCREAHRVYYRIRREQRRRTTTCPNCGGPGGMHAGGTCDACYQYKREHGVDRPPEVYDPPPPGDCSNCGTEMVRGRIVRGRCEPCSVYHQRHGVDRPERLYNPPTHCIACCRLLQHGRSAFGRCPACQMYLKRHGVDRPERLWSPTAWMPKVPGGDA